MLKKYFKNAVMCTAFKRMHDPCYNVRDIKCTTYIQISFFLMSHRPTLQVSMVDSKKKWKIFKCKGKSGDT